MDDPIQNGACQNMYYRHFSLFAGAASRRNLTPFELFYPLLKDFIVSGIPNKNLFLPDTVPQDTLNIPNS